MPQYFLNDKDRDRILAALDKIDGDPNFPAVHRYQPPENLMAPEIYVGILPCGEVIPARSKDVPGTNKVCLYKMEGTAIGSPGEDEPGQTYKLVPVLDLQDPPQQIRIDCYNIYAEEVTDGERYIRLQRSKYGRWLNEKPTGAEAATGPGNQVIPTENSCTGTCSWTWNELGYEWTPDEGNEDACEYVGTTGTTSDPCSFAATAGDCSCCPGQEGYTNPSTTVAPTTTTLDPDIGEDCQCQYPDHCGHIDGEVTETSCSVGVPVPGLDCTTTTSTATTVEPTTTTTPDCNCDTSTTLAACGAGCEWEGEPVWMGGGAWAWSAVSNDCAPRCPCGYPEDDPFCNSANTPCVDLPPPGPGPPAPPCTGNCHFHYSESFAGWVLVSHDCTSLGWCNGAYHSGGYCCGCDYPSHTGNDCESASTGCRIPPQNSTTQDPCAPCYSSTTTPGPTTSSTTTSCDPCTACDYPESKCCFNYSTECDQWVLVLDLCGSAAGSTCAECPGFMDWPPPKFVTSGVSKCVPCIGGASTAPPPGPCDEEGSNCDSGDQCGRCDWKYSCQCDPPAWVELDIRCDQNECPCYFPDYECNRSYSNWTACGSDYSISVETTAPPACGQLYSNYCLTINTSTTTPTSTTTTTVEPTTSDTTVTTCDPTTPAPWTTTTTTTVCPTSTTTTATSTTTTSCNPAPGCGEPVNPHYPCGNPPFDPAYWDTCCCHGPCCIYATNPNPSCTQYVDGELMNCVGNSTVWHCGASGGDCCGQEYPSPPAAACEFDTYFLGQGFTCEDCPETHSGTTETTTTDAPESEGSACCWNYGDDCTEDLTYGACQQKTGSMSWEADKTCAEVAPCPTSLDPGDSACCYNYGTCAVNTQSECAALGSGEGTGVWYEGKRCDQVECATTIAPGDGACCYNYGTCNIETESNCEARDNQSWTAGVGCGAVTCETTPPPTGSCCYNYGTCEAGLTEVACNAKPNMDAWYTGQGCPPSTACATTPAPGCDCEEESCQYQWDCDPMNCEMTGAWNQTGAGENSCTEMPCGTDCECEEPGFAGTTNGQLADGTCVDKS